MIDIHTHLLPGVDDGSRSIEQSIGVLERFAAQGVEVVVCTPHLDASAVSEAPYERHLGILSELVERAPAVPELRLGWEIMLDRPGVDLRGGQLGLGGSRAVLIEFPRTSLPPTSTQELSRLRSSGVLPVVAHPERYWGCTLDVVRDWRRVGACIQLDATGLLGGEEMARLARDMLREGLVDCIASDNHGDRRTLRAARDWLAEIDAVEQAELLTNVNPGRIMRGEQPIPVSAVAIQRPLMRRLRELMLGRNVGRTER